jgi:hypothetical protein
MASRGLSVPPLAHADAAIAKPSTADAQSRTGAGIVAQPGPVDAAEIADAL